jgi:hypothetical protein
MISKDTIIDEDAIRSLIPNTEWYYSNGILTVFTEGVVAPTPQEIAIEKIRLEKVAEDLQAEAAAKKAAAEAKLAALGLTSDDLKALGLGGN